MKIEFGMSGIKGDGNHANSFLFKPLHIVFLDMGGAVDTRNRQYTNATYGFLSARHLLGE